MTTNNPTNCFYQQHQNENSLVVENKFNPIHGRPCAHPGTKFKVLITYFVEINQQSDSFLLLTIIKTNKTKALFTIFSIEYIFLPQGDSILNNHSINTHIDCFKTISPLQVHI